MPRSSPVRFRAARNFSARIFSYVILTGNEVESTSRPSFVSVRLRFPKERERERITRDASVRAVLLSPRKSRSRESSRSREYRVSAANAFYLFPGDSTRPEPAEGSVNYRHVTDACDVSKLSRIRFVVIVIVAVVNPSACVKRQLARKSMKN